MATEKQLNGRIVLKSDFAENWEKATNFTPKAGELIIYLPDKTYAYPRLKVGDGTTNVNSLPFCDDHLQTLIENLDAKDVGALPITGGTLTGTLYTSAGDPLFIGTNGKIGIAAKNGSTTVGGFEVVGSDNKWQASMTAYNGSTQKNNSIIVNEEGPQYVNESGIKNVILHKGNYSTYAVPKTRTINGKALSGNITLSAADVDALPDTTHIPSALSEMTQDDTYQTITKAEKEKLAGVAIGANKYVHPTHTAYTSGLYKVTVDSLGHVTSATAVTKSDITGLGIPSSNTTYSQATDSKLGLVKIGYSGSGKNYAVQLDTNGKMYVNVPWTDTDTNTTYSQATDSTLGLVKIGYTETNKNYAVKLDTNGKMYVSVPWTDNNTTYSQATSSKLGLVKLYTSTGDSTDGTMTRAAITTALSGKEASGAAADALDLAKEYTDQKIAALVDGAPEALDTLDELAAALKDNEDILSTYVTQDTFNGHTTNTTIHITSTERQKWDAAYAYSQEAHAPSDAQKNQNAFSNVVVGSTTIAADGPTDTLTLVAGTNVTLTGDASGDKVTIAAKDTTYSAATASALGLVKVHGVKTSAVTVNSASATSGKFYPVEMNTDNKLFVNVPWADTNTTYSQATTDKLGLVKIGYAASGKNYAVQLDTNGKMYVNVPWTDTNTNTTYTAGTGLTLSDTTFKAKLNSETSLGTIGTTSKLYAVGVDANGKLCVNVPWTDNNTTYSQATSDKLGLVKIGYSASGKNYAVQLDANGKMYVNVPWTDTDTNTTYSAGTGLTLSGTTFKAKLNSETSLGTIGTTSKLYAVGVDANGKLCVSVPWTDTDTNTTYSAGTGITLSGTTFSNAGVRSIATGSANGTISVNTNGTSANVAVKGLGSAAYTASTAYATAAQGTKADNALPASYISGTSGYLSKFTASNKLGNSLISDDGSCTTIHSRLVVKGNGSSYNEGIRVLPASNGWSNIFFSADTSTSGNHVGGWLVGRRGAAGTYGAVGDFVIEHNDSNGTGLTLQQNGTMAWHGNQLKLNNSSVTLQCTNSSVKFIFA